MSRFIIGIDLGTTHCALAYLDRFDPQAGIQSFNIPQWDGDEGIVCKPTLPSFLYLLTKAEIKRQDKRLSFHPANDTIIAMVGREARQRLTSQADRVIHSAKSWLCHGGINRSAKILPWQSEEILGDQRYSPVAVESAFLEHLRLAWDDAFDALQSPDNRIAVQDILVTVPASFDEAAQRLTLEACRLAGLGDQVRLIEEPQAAFFDWLAVDQQWQLRIQQVFAQIGRSPVKILVCDIGGGTSDFSILELSQITGSQPVIKRLKVSNHILLGGDNIDLAIAHRLDQQRKNQDTTLRAAAWTKLINEARQLKEELLKEELVDSHLPPKKTDYYITIDQAGASLFDSTETIAVDTQNILAMILDGFYPVCDGDDRPHELPLSGLSEWGLPYAQDTAITRHLAEFLSNESIDAVLFAGGSLTPLLLRQRLIAVLSRWQKKTLLELPASSLDLAVSRGATAYSYLEEQEQGLVAASYPRSIFLKVDQDGEDRLLRLIPRGSPVGSTWTIKELKMLALVNQRVEFEVWTSSSDEGAHAGETVAAGADFHQLPPMQTILSYPEKQHGQIAVELSATITQTGLLQIFCVDQEEQKHQWALEFQTRDHSLLNDQAETTSNRDPRMLGWTAEQQKKLSLVIDSVFGKKKLSGSEALRPQELVPNLESLLKQEKSHWSLPQLRMIWEPLQKGLTRRSRSLEHEATWLHLAGYSLRPGFGALRDPDRCQEIWRCWELGLAHPKEARVLDQWWIMWRRVAGGLSQEQQNIIFDRIIPQIRKQQNDQASREMILLAGSLERVEMNRKLGLGRSLVSQIISGQKQLIDAKIWALARIASRIPLYGGAEDVVQPGFVEKWIDELTQLDIRQKHYKKLVYFYSQAGRRLDQRDLDLSPRYFDICLKQLEKADADDSLKRPVREYLPPDRQLLDQLFGEDLPTGITIHPKN